MFLTSICLENFRNYEKLDLEFAATSPLTIFTGQNAQGKTNLLEAIYLLSIAKSFRGVSYLDLIQVNKNFGRVRAFIEENRQITELEIFLSAQPGETAALPVPPGPLKKLKVVKINQTKRIVSDFLGTFLSVLFSPEDINLVQGEPALRRRFLNILLSILDRQYVRSLLEYQQILTQRNKLLVLIAQKKAKVPELAFWDQKLVTAGSDLVFKRHSIILNLNQAAIDYYRLISATDDVIMIKYLSSLSTFSREQTAQLFRKHLQERLSTDLKRQATSVGPHRDDVQFFINGQPLSSFGSRGEYRSLVLSLKLAEMAVIEKLTTRRPVLLLDDVFSELDSHRGQQIVRAISGHQTIITTTEAGEIVSKISGSQMYTVTAGKVIPVLVNKSEIPLPM